MKRDEGNDNRKEPAGDTPASRVRFLVPMDFQLDSLEALDYAVKAARRAGASITLLAVIELSCDWPPTGPVNVHKLLTELTQEAAKKLAALRAQYAPLVEIDTAVRTGLANEEIAEFANQGGYMVILMAKHRHRWWQRLFSRHTVERVSEKACWPVQVIPQGWEARSRGGYPALRVLKTSHPQEMGNYRQAAGSRGASMT